MVSLFPPRPVAFARLAVATVLSAVAVPVGAGQEMEGLIEEQFIRYDVDYLEHRELHGARLRDTATAIAAAEAAGRSVPCSHQLYLEAKWLHGYTAFWDRLDDKLNRVAASLEIGDQSFADEQSPVDGFWGVCHEEHFMRLAATIDGIARLEQRGERARFKIRPPGDFDTGKRLLDRLQSLLISDIAHSGIDHRSELGSLLTSFSLGSLKPQLREPLVASFDLLSPEALGHVAEAFRFFISGAQDPETGYWGAWYIVDGRVIKTADLSFTYHIIAYSNGQVEHWPEIIATTAAIEDEPYPYGWKHDGHYNNHNLYDVARIYKFGWPHIPEADRPALQAKLGEMLAWSLAETLDPSGKFKFDATFSNSLGAEYYFGVSFLEVMGYWDPQNRFWTDEDLGAEAPLMCCRIRHSLDRIGISGWQADAARQKLERTCAQC